jgi:hypothetical protein
MYVAYEMEEPGEGDCLRSGSFPFFTTPSFSAIAVRNHRLGFFGFHARRLSLGLERPVGVVPQCPVVLLVRHANIIGPPGRLHKQHEAVIGD